MKLSVIYQYSDDIAAVKDLMNQLTEETELIIMTSKLSKELRETESGNVTVTKSSRLETALSKARGEYISFICPDDEVTDCYIEYILNDLAEEADYIPLKWQLVNWHGFVFTGCLTKWRLFANAYRAELAKRLDYSDKGRDINVKLLGECTGGKAVENIIYKHWR